MTEIWKNGFCQKVNISFWKDLGKSLFGLIFAFFVSGGHQNLKDMPKNVIFIVEHSFIGNLITSSARYDISYSDNYF